MSGQPSEFDPWEQWSQDPSAPPADWSTVGAIAAAARQLVQTLDVVLADIGADGPEEVSDTAFVLRGQLEVAEGILAETAVGHRRIDLPTRNSRGGAVTVVCDIDDDPPELMVVLQLAEGQNPYFTVDERLSEAGIRRVTPILAFTGDITSLVTAGSGMRILRIPA